MNAMNVVRIAVGLLNGAALVIDVVDAVRRRKCRQAEAPRERAR